MKDDYGNLKDLFSVAYNMMFASSGDGCSMIVSKDYEILADKYEEWAVVNNLYDGFNKVDYAAHNHINFERDQEAIVFTNEIPQKGSIDFYEFTAILPDWYVELLKV